KLQSDPFLKDMREAYRVITLDGQPGEYRGQDFFAKLDIAPGTEARRALPLIEDDLLDRKLQLAMRQRNFMQAAKRLLPEGRLASGLIADVGQETRGMPDDQAALMLAQLADAYRRLGQWDLAEATLVDMVERYPHEAASQDAMRWLVQLWISSE